MTAPGAEGGAESCRYEIVDMFADRPFTGSALAVVPDAASLDAEQMQAVAAELGREETAFVLPPTSPETDYRVRVFTPTHESPYGGHSALGTAATLVRLGAVPAGRVVQECAGRSAALEVDEYGGGLCLSAAPAASEALDAGPLLDAVGLGPADLDGPSPSLTGFGPRFHLVGVRPDALATAVPRVGALEALGVADLMLHAWDRSARRALVRMFAPGYGFTEDAACASAALALGVALVEAGELPTTDGTHGFVVRQGREIDRPATLTCAVRVREGRPEAARVCGRVLPSARGRVLAPAAS